MRQIGNSLLHLAARGRAWRAVFRLLVVLHKIRGENLVILPIVFYPKMGYTNNVKRGSDERLREVLLKEIKVI